MPNGISFRRLDADKKKDWPRSRNDRIALAISQEDGRCSRTPNVIWKYGWGEASEREAESDSFTLGSRARQGIAKARGKNKIRKRASIVHPMISCNFNIYLGSQPSI